MKLLPLATSFLLTSLACALPVLQPAQAGTGIQKCQTADGGSVYTDTACGAFGAVSTPIPGALLTRIVHDEERNAVLNAPGDSDADAPGDADADALAPSATATARRSPADGCARSPTQLSMDLRGSLAMGDVNRLAESYHWVGLTQKQAKPIMQRLERITHQSLLDLHFFDASIGVGGMQLADADNGGGDAASGVMQLVLGDTSPQTLDFDVQRYAGCYFIRF